MNLTTTRPKATTGDRWSKNHFVCASLLGVAIVAGLFVLPGIVGAVAEDVTLTVNPTSVDVTTGSQSVTVTNCATGW